LRFIHKSGFGWGVFEKIKTASPKAIPHNFTHKLFRRPVISCRRHSLPATKNIHFLKKVTKVYSGGLQQANG